MPDLRTKDGGLQKSFDPQPMRSAVDLKI
jgi:hypothetical protein